ncbi:MAG TPA: ATPase, T2SS/T4P/T4SS family, partial [Bacteroidia bacterium]|nr:ATPase, T2SS/T4P/T4SS family [Bacteroidia bacterium]
MVDVIFIKDNGDVIAVVSIQRGRISVEDPVEFVYKDKKSIISQRQVGRDTFSFANALRGALREDPDVILV